MKRKLFFSYFIQTTNCMNSIFKLKNHFNITIFFTQTILLQTSTENATFDTCKQLKDELSHTKYKKKSLIHVDTKIF